MDAFREYILPLSSYCLFEITHTATTIICTTDVSKETAAFGKSLFKGIKI